MSYLTSCPVCGGKVSTGALRCPHCGEDIRTWQKQEEIIGPHKTAISRAATKIVLMAGGIIWLLITLIEWTLFLALNAHTYYEIDTTMRDNPHYTGQWVPQILIIAAVIFGVGTIVITFFLIRKFVRATKKQVATIKAERIIIKRLRIELEAKRNEQRRNTGYYSDNAEKL